MIKNKEKYSIISKITVVFMALLVSVFLFYTGDEGFAGIQDAKYKMFLYICGGYVAVSLICLIEGALVGVVKLPSVKSAIAESTVLQRLTLLYLLFTWVSALVSDFFPETVIGATRYEGALTITVYCLCFLLVSKYGRVHKLLIWVFAVSIFVFATICIIQLFDINIFSLYPEGYKYSDAYKAYPGAYLGTIGNVDLVAAFLCMAIPVLSVAIIKLRDIKKWFLLIPLILLIYVLIKMNVLAGIVGIVAGMSVGVPIALMKKANSKKHFAIVVSAVFLGLMTLIYFVDFKTGLLYELHNILHGRIEETFGSGRIHIWKCVIKEVPEHLFFGSGPDTMVYAGLEPFTRFDSNLNTTIVSNIDVAHNEYLNVLSQQGLFAFLSYSAIIVYAVYKWMKDSSDNTMGVILGSAVFCYSIQAMFGLSMCITAPFFWVILGLLDNSLKGDVKLCGKRL